MSLKNLVKNFLNIYWLRPETAIWRTIDSVQLSKIKFQNPILDLGCGDGLFSFTNLKGEVDYTFDVYRTIKNTVNFFKGRDIHDQWTNVKPKIVKQPSMKIAVGVDWKQNLLDKAANLNFYKKLIKFDVKKPLPFKQNMFETIFSNMLYWIDIDMITLLKQVKSICNGKLIIIVPDYNFKKSLIFNHFIESKKNVWAKMLDREIYHHISMNCYSLSKWQTIISKAGFKIQYHSNYLSTNFIKFWSIGLRPYSPYLIDMSNKLDLKDRTKIKKRLISELSPLLASFVESEMRLAEKGCFHLFVLEKRK